MRNNIYANSIDRRYPDRDNRRTRRAARVIDRAWKTHNRQGFYKHLPQYKWLELEHAMRRARFEFCKHANRLTAANTRHERLVKETPEW